MDKASERDLVPSPSDARGPCLVPVSSRRKRLDFESVS